MKYNGRILEKLSMERPFFVFLLSLQKTQTPAKMPVLSLLVLLEKPKSDVKK